MKNKQMSETNKGMLSESRKTCTKCPFNQSAIQLVLSVVHRVCGSSSLMFAFSFGKN